MRTAKIFFLWASGRMSDEEAKDAVRNASDITFFRNHAWGLGESYDDGDYSSNLSAMENLMLRSEHDKLIEFMTRIDVKKTDQDD